jgi:hypothetical protein
LYLLAGALFVWIAWRLFKRLPPPPRADEAVRPNAIKGPMAFGPHDGPLFRNLGRTAETSRLVDHILNDQVGLVVVMGESGAGKTSLLRAGLADALQGRTPAIDFYYWEATPEEPEASILATVKSSWRPRASSPESLNDLLRPPAANARRVIVFDQFEQLTPDRTQHRAVFELLKSVVTRVRPPFRSTLIVSFREDYTPVWLQFEHAELDSRRQIVEPVRQFTEMQARSVIAFIAEQAGFSLDAGLVDDLLAAMKNSAGRISPVDIGITLLALHERALIKADHHIDRGEYRIAGGATGLLAEYIDARLDRYHPSERMTILNALLELADLEADRRVAEGLPADTLAQRTGLRLRHCNGT